MIEAIGPAYLTAASIGALHGLEPGHGWPVAAVYALSRRHPWPAAGAAGALVGGAHLVSSFAVVALFEVLDRWVGVTETGWIGPLAGLALIIVGVIEWRRGGHRHASSPSHSVGRHRHRHTDASERPADRGLWGIAVFAFALGFAHEEEFAIIALCAGRASCWWVMAVYATAVAGVILVLTLASVAAFDRFRERLDPWAERLPRISAVVLIAMGILYAIGLL